MKKLFSVLILVVIFLPGQVMAQGEGESNAEWLLFAIAGFLVFTIIVLGAIIFSLSSLQNAINQDRVADLRKSGVEVPETESWLSTMYQKLWAVKPMEEESDILMDHDYDGIRELDNHLPPWWKYLFYFTIVFAVVYMVSYHLLGTSPLQIEEYNMEMAAAEQAAAVRKANMVEEGFDEADIAFTDDPEVLARGKKTFDMQCAACHRVDGGGSIGPNLTDEYWIHGGSVSAIYNTIKVGVPNKGMISWEASLSPAQMLEVSSYILTMAGSNPENPKAPQGDKEVTIAGDAGS